MDEFDEIVRPMWAEAERAERRARWRRNVPIALVVGLLLGVLLFFLALGASAAQ